MGMGMEMFLVIYDGLILEYNLIGKTKEILVFNNNNNSG